MRRVAEGLILGVAAEIGADGGGGGGGHGRYPLDTGLGPAFASPRSGAGLKYRRGHPV
jgi:hypothetical protein